MKAAEQLLDKERDAKNNRNEKQYDNSDDIKEIQTTLNFQKLTIKKLKSRIAKKKKDLENVYNYSMYC